jgi:hypothetical protein
MTYPTKPTFAYRIVPQSREHKDGNGNIFYEHNSWLQNVVTGPMFPPGRAIGGEHWSRVPTENSIRSEFRHIDDAPRSLAVTQTASGWVGSLAKSDLAIVCQRVADHPTLISASWLPALAHGKIR